MSIDAALAQRNSIIASGGKRVLNVKYPREFELYVLAFELIDLDFNTKQYFIFPVNPSQLEESQQEITNIKKTLGGITVLKNTSFIPTDISISGNFGRNFKVLLGEKYEDFIHSFQTQIGTNYETKQGQFATNKRSVGNGIKELFDERVKTGYGCIKILEDIVREAKQPDRRLIFHNPALGNSYLVEIINFKQNMSEQNNMIWNYSLQMKSVAPLESIYTKQDLEKIEKQLAVTGYMQKRTNELVNTLSSIAGDGVELIGEHL